MGYWKRLSKNFMEHIKLNKKATILLFIISISISINKGFTLNYYDGTRHFYFPVFIIIFLSLFIGGIFGIVFFGKKPKK